MRQEAALRLICLDFVELVFGAVVDAVGDD
jgi:hypothetical protein